MNKYLFYLIILMAPVLGYSQSWFQIGQNLQYGQNPVNSLALSGNGNIVAYSSSFPTDSEIDTGLVKVLEFDGTSWNQIGQDINYGLALSINYGKSAQLSLSLSDDGHILAIGAPYTNGESTGQVRIYQFNEGNWVQLGSDIEGVPQSYFGNSVALSSDGTKLVVGGNLNSTSTDFSGMVKVYNFIDSDWTQVGQTLYHVEEEGYGFGNDVDINDAGNIIAVSYTGGAAKVFQLDGSVWIETGSFNSNYYVSLNSEGNRLAVGNVTATNPVTNVTWAGEVKVFDYQNGTWNQAGSSLYGNTVFGWFGRVRLDADGNTLAVGSEGISTLYGKVDVYRLVENDWAQLGEAIPDDVQGSFFGSTVGLSNEGNIVASGSREGTGSQDLHRAKVFYLCDEIDAPVSQTETTLTVNFTGEEVTYQWLDCQNGNTPIEGATGQSFTPEVSGSYTVLITAEMGCTYVLECIDFCVIIDTSVTATTTTLTANYAGAGAAYQWLDCDNENAPITGATGQFYTPTVNGNYAVQITDAFGCVSISECISFCLGINTTVTVTDTTLTAIYTGTGITYQWVDCENENAPIEGADGQSYTPEESGTYAVQIITTDGCVQTSECIAFCIGIDTGIAVQGNTMTANYTGEGVVYQWLDCDNGNTPIEGADNRVFSPMVSGTYAVRITTADGCVSTSSCFAFCLTIDTGITVENNMLTANYSGEGAVYQWLDCDNGNAAIEGATGQTFTPVEEGNYAVRITDAYGCVSISDCVEFTFLGIDGQNISDFAFYPNPVKDVLYFKTGNEEIQSLEIFEFGGKLLLDRKGDNSSLSEINLGFLSKGVYLVRVVTHQQVRTFKIVKE